MDNGDIQLDNLSRERLSEWRKVGLYYDSLDRLQFHANYHNKTWKVLLKDGSKYVRENGLTRKPGRKRKEIL